MPFQVTATITINVPTAETGPFLTALNAAVPSDAVVSRLQMSEALPSPVAGTFAVSGSLVAQMSEQDAAALLMAAIAAVPKDATLVSWSMTGGLPLEAP